MISDDLRERIKAKYEEIKNFQERAVGRIFSVHHIAVQRVVQNLHKGEKSQALCLSIE